MRVNTALGHYSLSAYGKGFPEPAKCIRDIQGVRRLAGRAAVSGNAEALVERLVVLRKKSEHDDQVVCQLRPKTATPYSYFSLVSMVALSLSPSAPETVPRRQANKMLFETAEHDARQIEAWCESLIDKLKKEIRPGRGGLRNRPHDEEDEAIIKLGIFFQRIKGRPPGATVISDGSSNGERVTGPFIEFCHAFFWATGRRLNRRSIYDYLLGLKGRPDWAREHRKRRWED